MSRYKVLPVPQFFENIKWQNESFADDEVQRTESQVLTLVEIQLFDEGFTKIEPVFNRDGWYFDRQTKKCWYEWKGTAWTTGKDLEQFQYELRQLGLPTFTSAEIKAIQVLLHYNNCNAKVRRELNAILWDHSHQVMLRNIYRNTKLWVMKNVKKDK